MCMWLWRLCRFSFWIYSISLREPAATTTTDKIDEADSNGKDAAISIKSISK